MSGPTLGDDIFIHFLEHEVLALVGRREAYGRDAERAFRISLVLAERTVVPATAYWEDEWAAPLLEIYASFREAGRLKLVGTASRPEEYLESKREHYAREPTRYARYFIDPSRAEYERLSEMWCTRSRSTTVDIAEGWRTGLNRGDVLFERLLHAPVALPTLDRHLLDVPELLGTDAFIGDFVDGALRRRRVLLDPPRRSILGQIIARDYVRSYLVELGATALKGGPTSQVDHLLSDAPFAIDLTRVTSILKELAMEAPLAQLDTGQLLDFRLCAEWEPVRADILARAARTGSLWLSDEAEHVKSLPALRSNEPLAALSERCSRYSEAIAAVGRQRLVEEADLERRRKGPQIVAGPQSIVLVGDLMGDVTLTGNRLQIGGSATDLATAPSEDVIAAIAQLFATITLEHAVAQLEAASRVVDARDDIGSEQIAQEVAKAFGGPRDLAWTERVKAIASNIAQQTAVGAASGGLTAAVLAGLRAVGLA